MRTGSLFVAEGFNGIEAGGANRRDHSADEPDGGQNDDSDDQGEGVNHQANVAGLGMFGHGAVKREPASGKGDDVCQDDAEDSANEGNRKSLGQELEEDMATACAQRFLDADFS